jgi:hypothetical protein
MLATFDNLSGILFLIRYLSQQKGRVFKCCESGVDDCHQDNQFGGNFTRGSADIHIVPGSDGIQTPATAAGASCRPEALGDNQGDCSRRSWSRDCKASERLSDR